MSYQCIKSTNKQIPNEDLLDLQKEIQKLDKNEEICYKDQPSRCTSFKSVRRLTKNM